MLAVVVCHIDIVVAAVDAVDALVAAVYLADLQSKVPCSAVLRMACGYPTPADRHRTYHWQLRDVKIAAACLPVVLEVVAQALQVLSAHLRHRSTQTTNVAV